MKVTLQAYVKDSVEAVDFYRKAFDATLGYHVLNPDNTFMHAEIMQNQQHIISLSESEDGAVTGKNMQFCVNFGNDNVEALKYAYEVLTENGQILYPLGPCEWNDCIADVIDKFGVRWYLAL